MNATTYADDSAVRALTEEAMRTATVFQLFQLAPCERDHSMRLLGLLSLPAGASVLSLGCGVGGMEAYWQQERPDMSFTLVNISAAQLSLCLADGLRVLADAQEYRGEASDAVVAAYMLGHVDPRRALKVAAEHVRPGGVLLVSDVFDSSPEFDLALQYDSPSRAVVERGAAEAGLELVHLLTDLQAPGHVTAMVNQSLLKQTSPAVLVYRRPA